MILAQYLDSIEKAPSHEASLLQLLHDLKAGRVKHDDVLDVYHEKYLPIVKRDFERFGAGSMFVCQRQNFDQFMDAESYGEDFQAYLDYRAHLNMLHKKDREMPAPVSQFLARRIFFPSVSFRAYLRNEGSQKLNFYRNQWAEENQRNGWNWR